MSERERYQPGVPCWVDLLAPDPEAATRFYAGLFGWEFAGPAAMPGDPPGRYYVARLRGRDVAGIGSSRDSTGAPSWSTHVSVNSAAETARLAVEAGGTVIAEPLDAMPAGRLAVIGDPGGAELCVWEPREREGAQLVNEPSAWAMSALQASDLDAATGFYDAVFGWNAEPFGDAVSLWRLPGFVGGEPGQPVPRDVVAALAPAAPGASARWSVDFWIDDAEAAAARTVELGGRVLLEPHDAAVFKRTVIEDPQGAAISVSELVPERLAVK
jgi:uncharacterized protein